MGHLTFEDLERCLEVGDKIDWHDDYQHKYAAQHPEKCILTEEWVDRPGPLTIIHLSTMSEKEGRVAFVGYKCSDPACRRCTDETLTLRGHHKIMRLDGIDVHPRYEFIETKKQTIIKTEDQPVFRRV